LVTGITGQDGSYLAEFLLERGYDVLGVVRQSVTDRFERIAHLRERVTLIQADLTDQASTTSVVADWRPHEIYNLAAHSFVPMSWQHPVLTADVTALGCVRLLEAVRTVDPAIRFYQASSSEMFGATAASPQNEATPVCPCTPYGAAKAYAHFMTLSYRRRYGLFCVSGILYNHESPRRGGEFVTRKVTAAAARIARGLQQSLPLGNLDGRRDWGAAQDYVRAMWLMLQHDRPEDFVVATGVLHEVRDLCRTAFEHVGLDWRDHVVTDERLLRPDDPVVLCGDAAKARRLLRWQPEIGFDTMVRRMVDADLAALDAVATGE